MNCTVDVMEAHFVRGQDRGWIIWVKVSGSWLRRGSCSPRDLARFQSYHRWLGDHVEIHDETAAEGICPRSCTCSDRDQ